MSDIKFAIVVIAVVIVLWDFYLSLSPNIDRTLTKPTNKHNRYGRKCPKCGQLLGGRWLYCAICGTYVGE